MEGYYLVLSSCLRPQVFILGARHSKWAQKPPEGLEDTNGKGSSQPEWAWEENHLCFSHMWGVCSPETNGFFSLCFSSPAFSVWKACCSTPAQRRSFLFWSPRCQEELILFCPCDKMPAKNSIRNKKNGVLAHSYRVQFIKEGYASGQDHGAAGHTAPMVRKQRKNTGPSFVIQSGMTPWNSMTHIQDESFYPMKPFLKCPSSQADPGRGLSPWPF